jgi:dipeptidase
MEGHSHTEDDLERKIKSNLKVNLSEHQRAYTDHYKGKNMASKDVQGSHGTVLGRGSFDQDGYLQQSSKDKKMIKPIWKPKGSTKQNKAKSNSLSSYRPRGLRHGSEK